MGTFNITSSNLNNQYTYSNATVIVVGNYNMDATTNTLKNLSGSCYHVENGEQGEYFGDFNGYMRDGEVKYSISEMTRRDANLVWDAIDEIEAYITGQNANSEE